MRAAAGPEPPAGLIPRHGRDVFQRFHPFKSFACSGMTRSMTVLSYMVFVPPLEGALTHWAGLS